MLEILQKIYQRYLVYIERLYIDGSSELKYLVFDNSRRITKKQRDEEGYIIKLMDLFVQESLRYEKKEKIVVEKKYNIF
jgi:hypothetical protein